jgi:hypothetical protein
MIGVSFMRTNMIILMSIMAGIYFSILVNVEEDFRLNYFANILVVLTFITGYLLNKMGHKKTKGK